MLATKELAFDGFIPDVEIAGYNRKIILLTLEKHRRKIPQAIWNESLIGINRAFDEFEDPIGELGRSATSAFFVHTRRNRNGANPDENSSLELDDSRRCFSILDPKYGIPEVEVERIWHLLPPFKTGEIKGSIDGRRVNCAIISVPITPRGLEDCSGPTERVNYARPRINKAVELATKIGAHTIGLGETLASLTHHGRVLKEKFPNLDITTGHAFTTYFMSEWAKFVAEKGKIDIKNSPVSIIGANGSIGSSVLEMLLFEGVRKFNLHDTKNMVGSLEKKKADIISRYPDAVMQITGGNDQLKEACGGSRIVLVATSTPKPFIKAEHLEQGTFVINDSQPPSITRDEAQKANSVTLWVVGSLPKEMHNTFNTGLVDADWTCALEVVALDTEREKPFDTVGRVNPQRVTAAGKVAKRLGIDLALPQSWGVIEDVGPIPVLC